MVDVALMHRLVIVDRHANDRTGDARGDADDVGADLAIAGPGSLQVAVIKGPGRPGGQLAANPERVSVRR